MITSPLLARVPGIVHGFGTAQELIPAALQAAWDQRPDKKQVHGKALADVTSAHQACGEVDGLYSAATGIPVSIVTADCVPILLARRDGGMVAALHAGWRGLIGGLIENLWLELKAKNEDPAQWVASIGPAVGSCCYQVSEELAQQFIAHYPALPANVVCPTENYLDLSSIARHVLQQAGVGEVEQLGLCTKCVVHTDGDVRFRSYRRGDRGSQQNSGLMRLA